MSELVRGGGAGGRAVDPRDQPGASGSSAAEDTPEAPQRLWPIVAVAAAAAAVFVLRHAPTRLFSQVNPFDEGIFLSAASFSLDGLVPYRDFYLAYGPAVGWYGALTELVGGETLLADRAGRLLLSTATLALLVYLIGRRRSVPVAALFGAILVVVPPAWAYVGAYLLLTAAVATLIGWRRDVHAPPLASPASLATDRRLLVAGCLLGLMAWFRWELSLVLAFWTVLVAARPTVGSWRANLRPVFLVPWLVGAGPYLVIAALGGLRHLLEVVHYAAFDYGTYRGAPLPWSAPEQLVTQVARRVELDLAPVTFTLSFFVLLPVLALLVIGWAGRALAGTDRLRLFAADSSRVSVLLGLTATWLLYSTSTRATVGHAGSLMAMTWLLVLWNRPRPRWLEPVGLAVLALVLLTQLTPLAPGLRAVPVRLRQIAAPTELPKHAEAFLGPADRGAVVALARAWRADGQPRELFVLNRVNDITHVNRPFLYWLFDAEPASWLTLFDPGFADQQPQQREMVDDLCASRAPLAQWRTTRSPAHPPERRFSPYLDRFVALNYDATLREPSVEYRVFGPQPCLRPEAATPEVVEARRVAQLAAGDLAGAGVLGEWQVEAGMVTGPGAGDRLLLAAFSRLYNPLPPPGLHRELLARYAAGRRVPRGQPVALELAPTDPAVTGAQHLMNALLITRDQKRRLPAPDRAAQLAAAVAKAPELAPVAQLLASDQAQLLPR